MPDETIGGVKINITGDYSGLISDFMEAENLARNAGTRISQALVSGVLVAGGTLTATVTAPMVALGTAAVQMSEKVLSASRAFETLLGSAGLAKGFLEDIKRFALETPFEFPQLVEASKRMLALGFAARDIVPMLRSIGDAVALLGGGEDKINRIVKAFGDMQAKGKVSAQEMKQFAEVGINAWQALADKMGTTVADVMKKAEKGLISAAEGIPAILAKMNRDFAGAMEKQADTLTGVWSKFKEQAQFILSDIGDAITPVLKRIVKEFAVPFLEAIRDITASFKDLSPGMQNFIIGVTALAAAMGPLLVVVGSVLQGFLALDVVVVRAGLTWAQVATAAGSMATSLGLVGAAVAGIHLAELDKDAVSLYETFKRSLPGIADLFKDVTKWIGLMVSMMEAVSVPARAFLDTVERFASSLRLADVIRAVFPQLNQLHNLLVGAATALEYLSGNYKSMADAAATNLRRLSASNRDFETTVEGLTQRHIENQAILLQIGANEHYEEAQRRAALAAKENSKHVRELGIAAKEAIDPWTKFGEEMRKAAGFGEAYEATAKDIVDATRDITAAVIEAMEVTERWLADGTAILKNAPDFEGARPTSPGLDEMAKKYPDLFGVTLPGPPEVVKETKKQTQELSKAAKEVSTIVNDMVRGIAKAITDWGGFGKVATRTLDAIGEAITRNIINKILDSTKIVDKLTDAFLRLASKIPGPLGDIFGNARVPMPGNKTPPVNLPDGLEDLGGGGGGGGLGGMLGGLAGAANPINMITGAVSAVSGVVSNFQFRAMNKALDNIVKHTLQTANDLSNLRSDEWAREDHLFFKMDDFENFRRQQMDTLIQAVRDLSGGGLSGDLGSSEAIEAIEELGTAAETATEAIEESAEVQVEANEAVDAAANVNKYAANVIEDSADTTGSSLINLSQAIGNANGSLDELADSASQAGASLASATGEESGFELTRLTQNYNTLSDQMRELEESKFGMSDEEYLSKYLSLRDQQTSLGRQISSFGGGTTVTAEQLRQQKEQHNSLIQSLRGLYSQRAELLSNGQIDTDTQRALRDLEHSINEQRLQLREIGGSFPGGAGMGGGQVDMFGNPIVPARNVPQISPEAIASLKAQFDQQLNAFWRAESIKSGSGQQPDRNAFAAAGLPTNQMPAGTRSGTPWEMAGLDDKLQAAITYAEAHGASIQKIGNVWYAVGGDPKLAFDDSIKGRLESALLYPVTQQEWDQKNADRAAKKLREAEELLFPKLDIGAILSRQRLFGGGFQGGGSFSTLPSLPNYPMATLPSSTSGPTRATVNVTAVDPTGRSVANAIVVGLEEQGIYPR